MIRIKLLPLLLLSLAGCTSSLEKQIADNDRKIVKLQEQIGRNQEALNALIKEISYQNREYLSRDVSKMRQDSHSPK